MDSEKMSRGKMKDACFIVVWGRKRRGRKKMHTDCVRILMQKNNNQVTIW